LKVLNLPQIKGVWKSVKMELLNQAMEYVLPATTPVKLVTDSDRELVYPVTFLSY
jgi:hypothetical protein